MYWGLFTASDTFAQWIMAIFTIAATGVSIAAVVLVNKTLKANTAAVSEAREANRIAREAVVAENRAWLRLHAEARKPWHIKDGRLYGTIYLRSENIGKSPATQIRIISKPTANPPHDMGEFRNILFELIESSIERFSTTPVLFPGEKSHAIGHGVNITCKDDNFLVPRVYVCIAYKTMGVDDDRYTYKALDIMTPSSASRLIRDAPNKSEIPIAFAEAMSGFIT